MSKSKGNVIDPLHIIDEYGADAFRFTLTSFAAMGRDIKLSTDRIAGYRNFANKLWNASRFTLMNLEGFDAQAATLDGLNLSPADRWILTRLDETIVRLEQSLTDYKFNDAASTLYSFTWHAFCDWYIELVKEDLYGDDAAARHRAQTVLYLVLEQLLRLLHPIMPFITEEIWQALPGTRPTTYLMQSSFPQAGNLPVDATGAAEMDLIMDVIRAIRNVRGEMDVAPGRLVNAVLDCRSATSLAILESGRGYIRSLARTDDLQIGVGIVRPEQAATQIAGDIEILLPLAGLIDVEEELKRLDKEMAKVQKDVEFFDRKLSNVKFVANAPADVLEKDRSKQQEAREKLAILQQSREKIAAIR